jgi:transcriptional regulator with GAF, ATPase, and Fis domain
LTTVAPPGARGTVIAGPLAGPDGPVGFLVAWSATGRGLGTAQEAVFTELLAPLAVVLDNERHFAELQRLREAALADNRALLSRLQRQEIADSIVGDDQGLRDVMERVEQVAPTDAPVLILGETGSGKEVVARQIHARSRRAQGPIVRVNCGAIPSELVDSELFGHERGRFTGALATRKGWFERADGGTLFLDEVAELPLAAQVRLLRILQDGSFERVGAQRSISVDVRIVAATHRDVDEMVRAGTFRQDLWYRISVFPIHLPPLRERREDLPALAAHFAARAGRRLGGAALAPSRADLDLLVRYDWPGNVRELAAVIERAAILGDGKRLEVAVALGNRSDGARGRRSEVPPSGDPDPADIETLDRAMARHIERALAATRGQIEGVGGAAALLGINPHTLRARMRKLGVRWGRFRR